MSNAQLVKLLRDHSKDDPVGQDGTSFTMGASAKKKFNIPNNKFHSFIKKYCELTSKGVDPDEPIKLFEVPGEYRPICVNCNFTFQLDDPDDVEPMPYNDDILENIVFLIQDSMRNMVRISSVRNYTAVLLESSPIIDGKKFRTSISIHFPYCRVTKNDFNCGLKQLIVNNLSRSKIFEKMDYTVEGDWRSIISDMNDTVPMYGSVGLSNEAPLDYSKCYNFIESTVDSDSEVVFEHNECSLRDVFDPNDCRAIFLAGGDVDPLDTSNLEQWLPILFLSNYDIEYTNLKKDAQSDDSDSDENFKVSIDSRKPEDMIHYLLPILSKKRVTDEPSWLEVGRAIYNIFGENDRSALEMWVKFSERVSQEGRDRKSCEERWSLFGITDGVGRGITIRTIGHFARSDNYEEYREWHDKWIENSVRNSTSCIHSDVAEVIYRMFWLDYFCTDCSLDSWYRFQPPVEGRKPFTRLVKSSKAVDLKRDITEKLIPAYRKKSSELSLRAAEAATSSDSATSEILQKELDLINPLIKKLGTTSYKKSVLDFCCEMFYDGNAKSHMDSNPYTTAWDNCVVEVCGNRAYMREGKMEDYITKNTGIAIREDLHWKDPLVKELLEWFDKVFPDKDLRHFFLKSMAACLLGKNAEKYFYVWSGAGDNSKSMIVKLLQATLGMYCVNFPVELLSGKKMNSSGPSPELAQARGAHVGIIAEPESDDQLRSGAVKRFTGGDAFFARLCNENGGAIEATFKLIFMCNRIPNIANADKAVMNRFLYLPFLATFTDDAPEDKEEQKVTRKFPKDPFFEDKISKLARAMAWVIFQYYEVYKTEGLRMPRIVREYTDRHWDENDVYKLFISESVEEAYDEDGKQDPTSTLLPSDLYNTQFKFWFRDNYPGEQVPTSIRFKEEMTQPNRLGKTNGRSWSGIKIKVKLATLPE